MTARCCGAVAPLSRWRGESHASLKVPGRLPPPHLAYLVSWKPRTPTVASGQLIERVLHRSCDSAARAKAHYTHSHAYIYMYIYIYLYIAHTQYIHNRRHAHEGVRARARSTRAYALLARATRCIVQRKERRKISCTGDRYPYGVASDTAKSELARAVCCKRNSWVDCCVR